jgi:hypothetical protein
MNKSPFSSVKKEIDLIGNSDGNLTPAKGSVTKKPSQWSIKPLEIKHYSIRVER